MSWNPNHEEKKLLQLILSMTMDCILGKGTDTKETYFANIKLMMGYDSCPSTDDIHCPGCCPRKKVKK